jgi:hypothetical protein
MATERHERIAEIANVLRAGRGNSYTGDDVAIIMHAWQVEYRERKEAGKVKPAPSNAWRREKEGE